MIQEASKKAQKAPEVALEAPKKAWKFAYAFKDLFCISYLWCHYIKQELYLLFSLFMTFYNGKHNHLFVYVIKDSPRA